MKRNPIAKALRSPHLLQKIVPVKRAYSRKIKHKNEKPEYENGAGDRPKFLALSLSRNWLLFFAWSNQQ